MRKLAMISALLFVAASLVVGTSLNGATLRSPDDLRLGRIGVLQGTIHERYAMKAWPEATILQYQSPSDLLLAVKSGKADAAIYSDDELMVMLRQNDDLAVLGDELLATPLGMGFRYEQTELRSAFNNFLRDIMADGRQDAMVRYWMKEGGTRMPEIAASAENEVLRVGILSDNGMPFCALIDNRLTGYSIELLDRFGLYTGRKITYVNIEFGSMIAALASRKIDMIGAVMAITPERRKKVAFSDPYYAQGAHLFALKKNIASLPQPSTAGSVKDGESFLAGIAESFRSNILLENRWQLILEGFRTTLVISVFAALLGTLLGALVCFMRMSRLNILRVSAGVFISLLRGTPVLVLLMLVFYVVFASVNIDPVLVAVIAFGLNFAAYSAEIFRAGIEGIDRGQTEAGIAMGFTGPATFYFIILPQTVRRILPVYKGEFISLVKMTSIVGYIAVQDLTKAGDIIRSRTFDAFFPLIMVAALYFFLSWALMRMLEYLEGMMAPKHRNRTVAA